MDLRERISALARLGDVFRHIGKAEKDAPKLSRQGKKLMAALDAVPEENPWFDRENVLSAFHALGSVITRSGLEKWTGRYPELQDPHPPLGIGVIIAGNIPLVGFHDFLSVLISGNRFYGKTSSRDGGLHEAASRILLELEPRFRDQISLSRDKLPPLDAVIATGSDNTARHFSWFYKDLPALIRKNMNGLAILNGTESNDELEGLAEDVFRYYGLGCRSVSKIFIPEDYDFSGLKKAFSRFAHLNDHPSWLNNLKYRRTLLAMQKKPFIDFGHLLLVEELSLSSPIAMLYYQTYRDRDTIKAYLETYEKNIQCVVANPALWQDAIPFGQAQIPGLSDYADRADTIRFLLSLHHPGTKPG